MLLHYGGRVSARSLRKELWHEAHSYSGGLCPHISDRRLSYGAVPEMEGQMSKGRFAEFFMLLFLIAASFFVTRWLLS